MPVLKVLALLASVGSATVTASTEALTLSIAVLDYADVPSKWLSRAKEETSRIYREIGVEVTWCDLDGKAISIDATSTDACTSRQRALSVLIAPGSPSMERTIRQGVAGFSAGTGDEGGRVAYVLYDRMGQFRLEQFPPILRAKLLGHLMAHEVGHLLLPVHSHSPTGLMRAEWSRAELELARVGRLRFTDVQAQLIRTKVSRLAVRPR